MKRYDCQGGPSTYRLLVKAYEKTFPYGDRDNGKLVVSADAEQIFRDKFVLASKSKDP
jgi:hypothetical protein